MPSERRVFEETLRKERLVVEDLAGTGLVHERYPTDGSADAHQARDGEEDRPKSEGPLQSLVRKAFE